MGRFGEASDAAQTESTAVSDLTDYCRQAITTRYLGPTDHRGPRVKAKCNAGTLTVSWDQALDVWENHAAAALALFRKLGWNLHNRLVMGSHPENNGYVFVQVLRG